MSRSLWARLLLAAVIVTGALAVWALWLEPSSLRIVAETQNARPDLALLAGDFVIQGVRGGRFVSPEVTSAKLAELAAPLGVFAVLGNHDWWLDGPRVRQAFETSRIPVLENRAIELRRGDCAFWLVGIGDFWEGAPDIEGALGSVPTDAPVLVPFVGRPIVPSTYGERFAIGPVVEGGRHLFVTPGVGTSILPVRFLVPPEISLLELRRAAEP